MSKKSAIILIITVFIGTLAALIWFYFNNAITPTTTVQVPAGDVYDPFGLGNRGSAATSTTINQTPSQVVTQPIQVLRKISEEPTSGATLFDSTTNSHTNIRYILRANGNIYETYTNSTEIRRISNTTVPKVYESLWLPDGQNLIIRYLKDITDNIQSFSVKINVATSTTNTFEGGIDGMFLPENITQLAINPSGDKIFFLTSNLSGSTGSISKTNGLNKKNIFESPLVEWIVTWPKEETITMTTRASVNTPGFLYFLNSKTGSFDRVLGNISGLTTKTNPPATQVLYSDSTKGTPTLYLYDIKKDESKMLPWNTLPEKCVWGQNDTKSIYCAVPKSFPTGNYPDAWYQGLVSFADSIWKYNTDTGTSSLVSDLQSANMDIDATDLKISSDDGYIVFTDKASLSLWGLQIK